MLQASIDAMFRGLKYDIYNLKAPGIQIDEIQSQDSDPIGPIKYCYVFWSQYLFTCYPSAAEGK
ncbi:hypothetical protein V8C42DRAFT_333073 [Trichoderma barbatum]